VGLAAAHLLLGGDQALLALAHVVGHLADGVAQRVALGLGLDVHRPVALGNAVGHPRQVAQVGDETAEGVGHLAQLVLGAQGDSLV
jgi:hypothetical protein